VNLLPPQNNQPGFHIDTLLIMRGRGIFLSLLFLLTIHHFLLTIS
jgi:hypothetical protein